MPRRAMRGVMPLFLSPLGQRGKSHPLSAWSLFRRLRGRPRRGLRIGSMVPTTSSKAFESWTFAAEWVTASEMPRRSTTKMALGAPYTFIRRGAGLLAPRRRQRSPGPGTLSPSRSHRLGRGGRASSILSWSRSHTPAAWCHSLSRRQQQVMPEAHPISSGGASPRG